MDVFGCYDYKRPVNDKQTDWRTSQYRGHRHITDLRMENKLNAKFADKGIYVRDPLLSEKPRTDVSANFVWKVRIYTSDLKPYYLYISFIYSMAIPMLLGTHR